MKIIVTGKIRLHNNGLAEDLTAYQIYGQGHRGF